MSFLQAPDPRAILQDQHVENRAGPRRVRRELVLMSADHCDWLVAAACRTARTIYAPDIVVDAVRRAEMDPKHATLDKLLK